MTPIAACHRTLSGGRSAVESLMPDQDRQTASVTAMDDILALVDGSDFAQAVRHGDGWRRPLGGGSFRHDYDSDVAEGNWEFHLVRPGLAVATVDFKAVRDLPRLHSLGDQLVLSAVIEGTTPFTAPAGVAGELLHGYCTIYGLEKAQVFETVYPAGSPLKWVSVFIDRTRFTDATGIPLDALPAEVAAFVRDGVGLAHRNVALSPSSSLAAAQIFNRPYRGGFEQSYLGAKAIELACHILHALAHTSAEEIDARSISRADHERLDRARRIISETLDEPLNIDVLAGAVGLTRQKLQTGFRVIYGDTVARVRDRARMELALDLIRSGDMSIIRVGLEAGYEHAASFTRAFKAAYGVSPLQMRQMARRDALLAMRRDRGAG